MPIIVGNRNEKLAAVDTGVLAQIQKYNSGNWLAFNAIESKGIEEVVLSGVDTTIQRFYQLFKDALKNKIFFEPAYACADYYFEKLMKYSRLSRLHATMRRNYAAALQDEAQQVINKWLKMNPNEITGGKEITVKYQAYPSYLERAYNLLGEDHYMYPILLSRKHFFEGYLLYASAMETGVPEEEIGRKAMAQFKIALQSQADLPNVYFIMSLVYAHFFKRLDSLEYYALIAAESAPSWVLPYCTLGLFFSSSGQFDRAKYYLDKANLIDSISAFAQIAKGWYYLNQNKLEEAELQFLKAIQLDSTFLEAYFDLGTLYYNTGRLDEAEKQF